MEVRTLCAANLPEHDQILIRTLCVLLARKLSFAWVVSTDPHEDSDAVIVHKDTISKESDFKKPVICIGECGLAGVETISKPVRSDDLRKALNGLDFKETVSRKESGSVTDTAIKKVQLNDVPAEDSGLFKRFSRFFGVAEKPRKVVLIGPAGAGKTTFIQSLGASKMVRTDVHASDTVRKLKQDTTVAMDHARVNVPGCGLIDIYGAPGQARFFHMLPILLRGASHVIICLHAQSRTLEVELETLSEVIRSSLPNVESLAALVSHVKEDCHQRVTELKASPVAKELDWFGAVDCRKSSACRQFLARLLVRDVGPFTQAR